MNLSILFALSLSGIIIASIIYVIFGQTTVRRLRKTPETKNALGIEFSISGSDIIKVAQALSLPKSVSQRIRGNSTTGALHPDPDILYKHTTTFERVFARVFYWLTMTSVLSMLLFAILNWLMGKQ